MKEMGRFEQTVHLMEGRCSRTAHIIKTEMRESRGRYSDKTRERIGAKVREMETKCEPIQNALMNGFYNSCEYQEAGYLIICIALLGGMF